MKSTCLAWSFLLAAAIAPPASAICVPTASPVDGIEVSLMSSMGVSDATRRREFAEISDGLAAQLGIGSGDIDGDPEAPNPQIRVRMYAVGSGGSGVAENNAVFTVVAIRTTVGSTNNLWVYAEASSGDEDSGQFKLFADPVSGTLVSTSDGNSDTFIDDFQVSAYRVPVSSLEYTDENDVVTPTTFYCEPSSSRSYLETVVRADSDAMVVLAPHGGNIETDTSAQAELFAETYEDLAEVPVSIWNLEGKWGNNQTDERWHITATSLDTESYPGLTELLTDNGGIFDRAVAFHGFSGDSERMCVGEDRESTFYQILIGGGAERNLKCAVAQAIDAPWPGGIAFGIRDEYEDEIDIPDACGREVTATGREGTHEDNIVNRLAVDHRGIQIEQSKTVRDEDPLRDMVAEGVAEAMATYDPGTNYCDPYIDP